MLLVGVKVFFGYLMLKRLFTDMVGAPAFAGASAAAAVSATAKALVLPGSYYGSGDSVEGTDVAPNISQSSSLSLSAPVLTTAPSNAPSSGVVPSPLMPASSAWGIVRRSSKDRGRDKTGIESTKFAGTSPHTTPMSMHFASPSRLSLSSSPISSSEIPRFKNRCIAAIGGGRGTDVVRVRCVLFIWCMICARKNFLFASR